VGAAADLLSLPSSAAAVLRSLLASAISEGIKVTAWGRGQPTRAVYRSMGDFCKAVYDKIGQIADSGFLETSSGATLDVVAKEFFGTRFAGATFGTTDLLIDNTGGNEYPYSPSNPLLLTSSVTAKQYTSTGTGVIVPLTNGQTLSIRALEAGSASTALPAQIDTWVTSVDGLNINQPQALIGEDAKPDEDKKAACRARVGFVPTGSSVGAGGARGAYETVAVSGPDGEGGVVRPDGTRITVTRVLVASDGVGGVIVYVADEDGPISASDLLLVEAAILAYARSIGVPCSVQNVATLPVVCTLTVWVGTSATATDDAIKAAITTALIDYAQKFTIGGYDLGSGNVVPLRGGLEGAAEDGAATVAKVLKLVFTTPFADLPIAQNEVPVITGTPTITVVRVQGA